MILGGSRTSHEVLIVTITMALSCGLSSFKTESFFLASFYISFEDTPLILGLLDTFPFVALPPAFLIPKLTTLTTQVPHSFIVGVQTRD